MGLNAHILVQGPVHTELLAIAMQKWIENLAKEWVEYLFLAMPAKNAMANAQCERILNLTKGLFCLFSLTKHQNMKVYKY